LETEKFITKAIERKVL